VEQVFGFVKKNLTDDVRSAAEECSPLAEKGVRGKGCGERGAALVPASAHSGQERDSAPGVSAVGSVLTTISQGLPSSMNANLLRSGGFDVKDGSGV